MNKKFINYELPIFVMKIKLVEIRKESLDIFSFIFEKPDGLMWKSGQFAKFTIPDLVTDESSFRIFSISASSREDYLMFTTRIRENLSDFKKYLTSMKADDEIDMDNPKGNFVLPSSNDKKIVGIAGGIGITPFRAILYDLYNDYNSNQKIELIYSDSQKNYAFLDELEKFGQKKNIDIKFISSIDETNLEVERLAEKYKNDAIYYISGPPQMIEGIKDSLKSKGIEDIHYDAFWGY